MKAGRVKPVVFGKDLGIVPEGKIESDGPAKNDAGREENNNGRPAVLGQSQRHGMKGNRGAGGFRGGQLRRRRSLRP